MHATFAHSHTSLLSFLISTNTVSVHHEIFHSYSLTIRWRDGGRGGRRGGGDKNWWCKAECSLATNFGYVGTFLMAVIVEPSYKELCLFCADSGGITNISWQNGRGMWLVFSITSRKSHTDRQSTSKNDPFRLTNVYNYCNPGRLVQFSTAFWFAVRLNFLGKVHKSHYIVACTHPYSEIVNLQSAAILDCLWEPLRVSTPAVSIVLHIPHGQLKKQIPSTGFTTSFLQPLP